METVQEKKRFSKKTKIAALTLSSSLFLAACEPTGIVGTVVTKFAQNLLFTSAQNHSPEYANEIQALMTALVFERNRNNQMQGQQQVSAFGQHAPDGSHMPQGMPEQDPYAVQQPHQDPNIQQGQPQQYPDPYQNQQPMDQGAQQYQQAMPQQQADPAVAPIALDASILVQRAGRTHQEPAAVNDGDTLYDGNGNPKAGDKIKLSFRTNCDCYVYIVGIDATGYAVPIFPDPESGQRNPVSTNNSMLVPSGTYWYGLDDYRGVEQIYFIASYTPRPDLDDVLARLKKHERKVPENNYLPVTQAAIVPQMTRGLVKVQVGTPVAVQTENGRKHKVTPAAFLSAAGSSDLVVTRWFNHEQGR